MTNDQTTVQATNEELRQLLVRLHSTITYAATATALILVGGWAVVGVKDSLTVPVLLPILAIASVAVTIVAWVNQEEVQLIGRPRAVDAGDR
ncbi:hypothetical protein [Nocardioides sp.]|uniref:hypothetical protein n=1 Tax=Nocardioides sp. TaxID=35761 RepID=UPI002ED9899B